MYQIKDTCSGCHACELACPVHAIFYDGPKYQIDPSLCISCGTCEDLCPTCSIFNTDEVSVPEQHGKVILTCDVVVCGGGSGLVAAVKAAQSGKKVILLEKAKRVGGNMCLAHAFFPIYSKVHAEAGIEDVREEAVRELSARTGGVISEELMRTAVYGTSEFMDWLLDFPGTREHFPLQRLGEKRAMGPIYGSAIFDFPHRIENCMSKDPSIGPGWMGSFIKNAMMDAISRQKLDVQILLEHEAKHLLCDETGRVTGVIAQDPGGTTEIHSKSVILTTGGYGGSDEKLQKYFGFFDVDRPVTRFSIPSNTGDAIDMLEELGVTPQLDRMFVSTFGPAHHPYSYSLYRLLDHPSSLSVNLNGKRWFDESKGLMAGAPNIKGSPKEVAWGIYTQKNVDDIMDEYLHDPTLSNEYDCYECYQEDLDREAGYQKPPVYRADTVEALAEQLQIEPSALVHTVEEYNRFCSEKKDEEFGKDAKFLIPREEGPYYAVYGQLFSECSAGGLMVDAQCRVLRNDQTPIPGLYAGGDATSAMHRRGELAVVSELTWAMASSYRSAVEALKES